MWRNRVRFPAFILLFLEYVAGIWVWAMPKYFSEKFTYVIMRTSNVTTNHIVCQDEDGLALLTEGSWLTRLCISEPHL